MALSYNATQNKFPVTSLAMKQFLVAVFIYIFSLTLTECGATDPGDSTAQGEVMFLEFTRRSVQIFRRSFVVGTVRVEEEGFRFVPAMVSPPGFRSQGRFERDFWYNPLFMELYIPFTNVRTIKHSGKITTKDRKMYMISSHSHHHWDKVYSQIKGALPPTVGKPVKMYDKFIEVLKPPKGMFYLELYRRGSMHMFHKTMAMGNVNFEQEGLRFIPVTQIPPGYTDLFDRVYWYNPLMRELFIPYSEIKSLRGQINFRMKDGRKYVLMGTPLIEWKDTVREIRAKITD